MRGPLYIVAVVLGGLWAITAAHVPGSHVQKPINLRLGHHTIRAEVVHEKPAMKSGLMHRAYLPRYSGMLFVFDHAKRYCFWTKNVTFPLSIAFLDAQGMVMNMADMEPNSTSRHCASAPAMFALEVNKTIFQTASIKPGSTVFGLPGTL